MSAIGTTDAVQVAVRVKPLSEHERAEGVQKCVRLSDGQIVVGGQRPFAFDHVYAPEARTESLFHELVEPLIDNAFLGGYNATVFAYGQTGAGKTHTMNGVTKLAVGRICRFLKEAASAEDNLERAEAGDEEMLPPPPSGTDDDEGGVGPSAPGVAAPPSLSVSMLELHNDTLADLLAGPPSHGSTLPVLTLVESDPTRGGGVYVKNLQECPVETEDDVGRVIDYGASNRKTAETLMNSTSSRSHMVLTITLRFRGVTSKLNLVDLAGSERIKKSLGALKASGSNQLLMSDSGNTNQQQPQGGATTPAFLAGTQTQDRLRECISINSGLLALGNVIEALCKKRGHIPFRQSKLTRILQDSLAGNCRTAMIACVSASDHNTDETVSTLNYANRAKSLTTRAVQNITVGVEEAQAEIAALRRERDHYRMMLSRYQRQYGDLNGAGDGGPQRLNDSSATGSGADLGHSVSRRIHQEREAFASLQHELSDQRQALLECETALDKERRVTGVLQEDLFKAEYDVMTSMDRVRELERELARARGEEVPAEDDDEDGGLGADDDAEEEDEEIIGDDDERVSERRRRRKVERLQAQRAENTERRAAEPASSSAPHPDLERQLREHERTVKVLREEIKSKEDLIQHLTESCDFAEHQVSDFEDKWRHASDESHSLEMNLKEALRQLEARGESKQNRERVVSSHQSRIQAQQVTVNEMRRKLDEAQALLRSKRADRDRLKRLQTEAGQLAEKLKVREDAHRRLQARSRTAHQHELQHLHRALRDSKAENRRLVVGFRKREDELKIQIAQLTREGPNRIGQRRGGNGDSFVNTPSHMGQQTPRGTHHQRHQQQQHHRDAAANTNPSTADVSLDEGGAGGSGRTQVMGRLMAHTASSRARVNQGSNVVSLAPDAPRGDAVVTRTNTFAAQTTSTRESDSPPPQRHSTEQQPRRSRSYQQQTSASPRRHAADALFARLEELDRLDRELRAITDERDRRQSEIAEIKQSYNVHRTQRALDAWRYYAVQLGEKVATCNDEGELRQLEEKLLEVRGRIQTLEQGTSANACEDKEDQLRAVEEHLDSLRVKRMFLLKIIRSLQHEQNGANEPLDSQASSLRTSPDPATTRGDHDDEDDDDYGGSRLSLHMQGAGSSRHPTTGGRVASASARSRFSSRPTTPRQTPGNSVDR